MNLNHQDTNLRVTAIESGGSFSGVAADWTLNRNGWLYEPGAFIESLAEHSARGTMPAMLLYHDMQRPIGRWESVEAKGDGLHVHGTLATDTRDGSEAYSLIKNGAISAMSLGCLHLTQRTAPRSERGGRTHEIISKADLLEISLVGIPANPNAKIRRVTSRPQPKPPSTCRRASPTGRPCSRRISPSAPPCRSDASASSTGAPITRSDGGGCSTGWRRAASPLSSSKPGRQRLSTRRWAGFSAG